MLTVPQAAKRLGVSSDTLYNWHKAGKLEIEFVNDKRRLVKLEDIERIESDKIPEGMKKCSTCGKVDPVDMFVPGFSKHPKCLKEEKTKWRIDHKEEISKRKAESYKKNPARSIERARKRYEEKPEEVKKKVLEYYYNNKEEISVDRKLRKYNITAEEYEELKIDSNGCCEICGEVPKKECIDHDHETGKVRGLLCDTCNTGIGMLKDNPEIIMRAAEYLLEHSSNKCIIEEEYMGYFMAGC